MYRSGVVVEVLECVRDFWVDGEYSFEFESNSKRLSADACVW